MYRVGVRMVCTEHGGVGWWAPGGVGCVHLVGVGWCAMVE